MHLHMNNIKPKLLFIGPLPPPYSGPELSMKLFLDSKSLNNAFAISFLQTNFRNNNVNKGKFGLLMVINFFKFFYRLLKELLFNRPDCVYYPVTPTQTGWIGRDLWTILLCKLFKTKVIIHLRGSHFQLNFAHFNTVIKYFIGFALSKVDKAIVQANYLKNQFHPYINLSDVEVLYQAIDLNEFPLGNANEIIEGKILVIGHLTKAKGFTDILKIIPKFATEFPFVKFYFAGNMRKGERGVFFNQFNGATILYEDPFNAEKIILNSDFKRNYCNLGIIEGDEKLKHFQTSDIFLSASYSEGFSRSLLEAMTVGKPLVYSLVGAHKEVLSNQNGIGFVPGDINQLYESLKKMIKNSERKNIGIFNRRQVEIDFSIEKIVEDFKTIILKTLLK